MRYMLDTDICIHTINVRPATVLDAAHAHALGVTLVTNNTREFERVPGLRNRELGRVAAAR